MSGLSVHLFRSPLHLPSKISYFECTNYSPDTMECSAVARLDALWQEALSEYENTTNKDLKALNLDSADSVVTTLRHKHDKFEAFDQQRKLFVDRLERALKPVKGLLRIADATASLASTLHLLCYSYPDLLS